MTPPGEPGMIDPAKTAKGVAFAPPPLHLIEDAARILAGMRLPAGAKGGIVGLSTDKGIQAAVVHTVGDRLVVGAWLGKSSGWGTRFTAGGVIQKSW